MIIFLAKIFPTYFAITQGDACTPNSGNFFFLPHWWEYLPTQVNNIGDCAPVFNGLEDIWKVALAILDMLLRIGGFVAVISIIIAGVQYITSMGSPDNANSARKRLTNSLIGLAIVLIASGAVAFIGNTLGG